jgi:hypothetical protein
VETGSGTAFFLGSNGRIVRLDDRKANLAPFIDRFAPDMVVATGPVRWEIAYDDLSATPKTGFADPALGAQRRAALEDSILIIGETLNLKRAATVKVRVERSVSQNVPELAHAFVGFPNGPAGFYKGHLATHLQTGKDPDPAVPDMTVGFNFYHSYHLGSDNPPGSAYDLRSVAVHEFTHALGILSYLRADGRSVGSVSNPGYFTAYDALLGNAQGGAAMGAGGRYSGGITILRGPDGAMLWRGSQAAAALGRGFKVATPSTFDPGTSISHVSLSEKGVMRPQIAKGVRKRRYEDYEVGALRDLGYDNATSPTSGLMRFDSAMRYPAASPAAARITSFDDQAGLDLVAIEKGTTQSNLVVYSGMALNRRYTYPLGDTYLRLSPARTGPNLRSGLLLATLSDNALVALAGLRLPADRVVLQPADFGHRHLVTGTALTVTNGLYDNPSIALGDLDDDGNDDAVLVSRKQGPVAFFGDGFGHYDRLLDHRRFPALAAQSPVRDLTIFNMGASTPGIEVTFGLGIPDIAAFNPATNAQRQRTRVGSTGFFRATVIARYGNSGFVGLFKDLATPMQLARISIEADGRYKVLGSTWPVPTIAAIAIANEPDEAFFTTASGHTVERKKFDDQMFQRFAGSVEGYRDGPADQALFNDPQSLCIDGNAIYVIDKGNALIRRIDRQTRMVTTVAGRPKVRAVMDGPKGIGTFKFDALAGVPDSCAVVGDNLYVLDARSFSDPLLRKVNLSTGFATTLESGQFPLDVAPRALRGYAGRLYLLQGLGTNEVAVETAASFPFPAAQGFGTVPQLVDIDKDGNLDLLMPLIADYKAINYMRGRDDGSFQYVSQTVFDQNVANLEVADLNGDAREDMIVTTFGSVRTLLWNGTKFVEDATRRIVSYGPAGFAWSEVKDFNRDGNPDLGVIDTGGIFRVYLGEEGGRWGKGAGDQAEHFRFATGILSARWFRTEDIDNNRQWELYGLGHGIDEIVFFKGLAPMR